MNQRIKEIDPVVVRARLADLLGVEAQSGTIKQAPRKLGTSASMMIEFEGLPFAIELKSKGDAATVGHAVRTAQNLAQNSEPAALPLVVVPYMGDVGKQVCEDAGVCWLDLSGNALLFGKPGLRIQIEGKPNVYKKVGRPQNLFAPKSARIARCLLMEPTRAFSQRELAEISGLDEGFTSRIVRGMEAQGLLLRESAGAVKMQDPDLMLNAWSEVYNFSKHQIVRGHIATRSGMETLSRLSSTLERHQIRHAATGLAGAWCIDHFAGFRLAVIYCEDSLSDAIYAELGFREEVRGANTWIVRPNDAGVFQGAQLYEGVPCVHPVQVYLDLKNHPERAQEAADSLKSKLWKGAIV